MVAAAAAAAALFFILWWMLQGEETPWVPAGLAASVVMLVAASAREVVARRSFRRHIREQRNHEGWGDLSTRSGSALRSHRQISHSDTLRALQRQAAEADAHESFPEGHLEVYKLCGEYLTNAEIALETVSLSVENRIALRAGQERVRGLQKKHMLAWAKGTVRSLTHEAQQRARLHEKVEIAHRALDCIESALKIYPDAEELNQSSSAVHEFITSSRVAHWVELAERAAFKGYYRRAIDCYCDALFYLTRENLGQDRDETATQITRQIDLLRARLDTEDSEHPVVDVSDPSGKRQRKRKS
jgi:tetratricopeptide (TPR) repeat protein